MPDENKYYIAIDLKSFYASVECVDRGLDPLNTNLVVADSSRTEKTICLAVTPSLKAYGIPGRARLFEVIQQVRNVNASRRRYAPYRCFSGSSYIDDELKRDASLELDYITAPPRMARYMEVSSQIFNIYMRYVSPEDIHVYSIDEVFIDATGYLRTYGLTAHEFAVKLIQSVLKETGITATAGIGTNLYLSKIAMDIVAKRMPADKDGVRIAELDEMLYRRLLWEHEPITDFWRVGSGYAKKLARYNMYTMGDIARCSLGGKYDRHNPKLLYRLFGVNAELLIDHAWGYENCTINDIKSYYPENSSISTGQVLQEPYEAEKGRLIAREMADMLVLDLVDKSIVTDRITLTVEYDVSNTDDEERMSGYTGQIITDRYGRKLPKAAHGSIPLKGYTSLSHRIIEAVSELYERIVDSDLLVRKIYVVAEHIIPESMIPTEEPLQLDFFTDFEADQNRRVQERIKQSREHELQKALLDIKKRYGKNAVLKGMNYLEGATARDRNAQVGGHRA